MESGLRIAGRYRLERALGGGGFGQVWRAADLLRDRPVAVKFLHRDVAASSPVWLSKFRQEAKIAARLTHPNIAAVDDFGEYDGQWYLVMEFLRGRDLAEEIAAHPHGLAVRRALVLAAQIADGLAAAHEHGIVHRDMKPANLMLLQGDRVKICDFGIAHIVEASASHTLEGQAGTPRFMAPEQWLGDPVDGRTDLYAFGGILYVMLTGRTAFHGPSLSAFMGQHLNAAPAPLSTARPEIPEALDRLVLELLAKDPDRRPAQAADVLARLRDIGDLPELPARPPVPRLDEPVVERRSPRERETLRAPFAPLIPRRTLKFGSIVVVTVLLLFVLGRFEHMGRKKFDAFTLSGHRDDVVAVAFSPDGSKLATGSRDHTAKLWETRTGKLLTTLGGYGEDIRLVAFSSDASKLITVSASGTTRIWDVESHEVVTKFGDDRGLIEAAALSPDGSRIVIMRRHEALVWNVASGKVVTTLRGVDATYRSVAFSPNGSAFATDAYTADPTVAVWNAETGDRIAEIGGYPGGVYAVAFSPDGTRVATGGSGEVAKVWDAATGDRVASLAGHRIGVASVAYSPDGSRIVTGGLDETARIWDARTGSLVTTLKGFGASVWEVVFSPDGSTLATAGGNTAKIWDPKNGDLISTSDGKRDRIPFFGDSPDVTELTYSRDGSMLAAASDDIVMLLKKRR
ncbi:serine/threonine-protein kinase [Actinomadura luteofluorescens]|uniref:WD40 repeat domain-containing serine/threonine protein kinase n=1 Tax=Actinomadura luteofluorescens TaxID=46163 RepID=UPI0030CFA744